MSYLRGALSCHASPTAAAGCRRLVFALPRTMNNSWNTSIVRWHVAASSREAQPLQVTEPAQSSAAAEQCEQQAQPQAEQQPVSLEGSRGAQLAAAAVTLAAVGAASYTLLSSQSQLPPLSEVLGPAAALVLGGPLLALLAARALLGDRLSVELHRGRLYLAAGAPSTGPPAQPGAVVVRPTGNPLLGNGAYAAAAIPAGTWLGDYTGELLDRKGFFARYPNGVGDFAAAIDEEWAIDAVGSVANTAKFHPVHMNHSRGRANVLRRYFRAQRRIAFFTAREVQPGEELLYDYGRAYWRGREQEELP